MPKKRKPIPALTQKVLLQECSSTCAFCAERDVATFEFHHIDENSANYAPANLIVACSSCHARITKGIISLADVVTRKRELGWRAQSKHGGVPAVSVNVNSSTFKGDIAQNITKITTIRTLKVTHPPGSIGANLAMKAYIDYLIDRYYTYRKADPSYGQKKLFSHAVIHQNILRIFGAKTFFLPELNFADLVIHLKTLIDRKTIQGKRNSSGGGSNYHSFEDHCQKYGFNPIG